MRDGNANRETMKMNDINKNSDAYNTGFEARVQNEPVSANPYSGSTVDAINWIAGYNDAA